MIKFLYRALKKMLPLGLVLAPVILILSDLESWQALFPTLLLLKSEFIKLRCIRTSCNDWLYTLTGLYSVGFHRKSVLLPWYDSSPLILRYGRLVTHKFIPALGKTDYKHSVRTVRLG